MNINLLEINPGTKKKLTMLLKDVFEIKPLYLALCMETIENINAFHKYENLVDRTEYNMQGNKYEVNNWSNVLLESS